jgi:hypothetical protein
MRGLRAAFLREKPAGEGEHRRSGVAGIDARTERLTGTDQKILLPKILTIGTPFLIFSSSETKGDRRTT